MCHTIIEYIIGVENEARTTVDVTNVSFECTCENLFRHHIRYVFYFALESIRCNNVCSNRSNYTCQATEHVAEVVCLLY